MSNMFVGLPFTGKTSNLINEYKGLVRNGISTDNILVLVSDSSQVSRFRLAIDLPVTGQLNIFTYWGFIQAEITRYWNWVEEKIYGGSSSARPTFINAEVAHYFISTLVSRVRSNGMFDGLVANSSQIGIQVLNNLNLAVTSGLGVEESFSRLKSFYGMENDKRTAFQDSVTVANQYRRTLKESRCIDYSMAVEFYNTILLPEPKYQALLMKKYQALIVDNLEESLPVQVDLITILLPHLSHVFMSFDPTGGMQYFGADQIMHGINCMQVFASSPGCWLWMSDRYHQFGCSSKGEYFK